MTVTTIHLLSINVGNTRTAYALHRGFSDIDRGPMRAVVNTDEKELIDALLAAARGMDGADKAIVVIASVNEPVATLIDSALRGGGPWDIARIGRDVPIPVRHALDEQGARTVGQDRLLNALGAYDVARQACVVVDAGSAVTVDFVDGEGVFQGGAIAPGARMMLRAMHNDAPALPDVGLVIPDGARPDEPAQPFGKNTPQAMLNGVYFGIRGMVRMLAERYAEAYDAYPQIIATGGDAEMLFESDELIETIVPDLTHRGMGIACREALTGADED
ncbi:MAG: type III pantothenate kinase [Phycisphaerales bacterium]|nr:MAG: type III pantothenate kinase [Phycisphaerales bacterium]